MRRPSASRMPVAVPRSRGDRRTRRGGLDLHDLGARLDDDALRDGEALDRADDLDEPAARVEDAVVEVEVAHQVVEARHLERRAAEEHRGVAEDLAQPRIGEPPLDVRGERAGEQRRELRHPPQQRGIAQARGGLVRVVEEAGDREVVRVRGGVEVGVRAARPAPGSMLSNRAVAASRPDRTSSGAAPVAGSEYTRYAGSSGTRSSSSLGASCRAGGRSGRTPPA